MTKKILIITSLAAISLTLWLMHFGSITDNSGALSKTGLNHPVLFTVWGTITYIALHANTLYGLKKIKKLNKLFCTLSAFAGVGMLLTLACDFDYSLRIQYYFHCVGSLAFSAVTGIMVFILFLFQFNKNRFYRAFTIIIGLILFIDLILLIIYQETALIEAVPIIFGLIILPIFNFYIKDKEYAAQ